LVPFSPPSFSPSEVSRAPYQPLQLAKSSPPFIPPSHLRGLWPFFFRRTSPSSLVFFLLSSFLITHRRKCFSSPSAGAIPTWCRSTFRAEHVSFFSAPQMRKIDATPCVVATLTYLAPPPMIIFTCPLRQQVPNFSPPTPKEETRVCIRHPSFFFLPRRFFRPPRSPSSRLHQLPPIFLLPSCRAGVIFVATMRATDDRMEQLSSDIFQ